MTVPVRVFLVDDHALFRAGVKAELAELADERIAVVGEAGSVGEAVTRITADPPDVVLLDVHMPDGGGRAVLQRLHEALPDVVFLALSVSDAAEDVIAVIRAGARGYVTKTISGRDLADAVVRVAAGDAVFSPRLAGFVLDAFAQRPDTPPVTDPELDLLSPREREVLVLVAEGRSNPEIAKALYIGEATVKTHLLHVFEKLGVSDRTRAVTLAIELGLL
jgi:DNA-binding NarL/FixJ family response regulator